jgi:arginase
MTPISILGIPHDAHSSFVRGPAEAPPLIRAELWSDAANTWTETQVDLGVPGQVRDLGDIVFDGARDDWELIEERAATGLESGPLISLGGDHAVTHPILRAVRRRHTRLTILHIDAHPDIYHDFQGNPRSHASPFARVMEEGLADRLISVGIRTATEHQRRQVERFGVELIEAQHFRDGLRLEWKTPVYVSLDIDGIDPAYAPGVSHREPGGLSTRQVINLIHTIDQPLVAADVVEYNPRCDIAGMTATVAAKLVREIAGVMVKTSQVRAGAG